MLSEECFSNLLEVNLNKDIDEIYRQRATEEAEQCEIDFIRTCKDVLINALAQKHEMEKYLIFVLTYPPPP